MGIGFSLATWVLADRFAVVEVALVRIPDAALMVSINHVVRILGPVRAIIRVVTAPALGQGHSMNNDGLREYFRFVVG